MLIQKNFFNIEQLKLIKKVINKYLKVVYKSIFIQANKTNVIVINNENTNNPLSLKNISILHKNKMNIKECKNVTKYDPLK